MKEPIELIRTRTWLHWDVLYWGWDWKFFWRRGTPKDFKPDYWNMTWRVGPIELRHMWKYIPHKKDLKE
jgi:hypothetical protein